MLLIEREKDLKDLKKAIDNFDDLPYVLKGKEAKKIKELAEVLKYNLKKKSILDFIQPRQTKTSELKVALNKNDIKQALKIAKNFKKSLTKEERDILTRTFEMFNNKNFYEQLGYNFDEQLKLSNEILHK